MHSYASRAYATMQVETDVASADPHQLVLLMFDAALAAVGRAAERMRARDPATKGAAVSKAIQIIEEGLILSLDESAGGPLAGQLGELYRYMTRRLLLASVQNDPAALDEVSGLLRDLRGAWSEIAPGALENR